MIRLRAGLLMAALWIAPPATAQGMHGMHMPGMTMPTPAKARVRKALPARKAPVRSKAAPSRPAPAAAPVDACPPAHAAMGHCTPAAPTAPPPPAPLTAPVATGTALPAGNAAPPTPPTSRAADGVYPSDAMARASAAMRREHGGMALAQILFNLAEVQVRRGREGYRWDGEGWYGGDIHRLVVKTEGEGMFGGPLDDAEVQALYSRAIDPYFNLQAGVRHNVGTGPNRSYATAGIEGLAPYWFDVEVAAFLSDKGDVLARIEAWYDQRLTQRLILQPRIEANLAAQDMPANRIGSGLSTIETGLRLRVEIAREFAPYVGLSWDRSLGDTARLRRAAGDRASHTALVAGIRTWF